MLIELTPQQEEHYQRCRAFVEQAVLPRAEGYDESGIFPLDLAQAMGRAGFLGALAPARWGGLELDMAAFGAQNEAFGRACASARSLITVHSMVLSALLRWGSTAQKERWLRPLAAGEVLAAFALSEPESGSDANSLQTVAVAEGGDYLLTGRKKWITFAQYAGLFLLFAKVEDQTTAFLVERDRPGLAIEPISPLGGCRASMLAALHLDQCRVPAANLVGRPGLGWTYVANAALDIGRFSVAWGCVGLAQACLEAALAYAGQRRQFGVHLREHALIQEMITDMVAGVEAARLLCARAAGLHERGDPGAVVATSLAKYFAARTAVQVSGQAVQVHGANGFTRDFPVHRHWRDAKVMEIIEGSSQIQQVIIARAYSGR